MLTETEKINTITISVDQAVFWVIDQNAQSATQDHLPGLLNSYATFEFLRQYFLEHYILHFQNSDD